MFINNKESRFNNNNRFQIQAFTKVSPEEDQDEYLPEAQTCFFSLSLPAYSSCSIMREKLLYAIYTCKEIDTDFIVSDSFIPEEDDISESESDVEDTSMCITQ